MACGIFFHGPFVKLTSLKRENHPCGDAGLQSQPWVHSEFLASLGYMNPRFKEREIK